MFSKVKVLIGAVFAGALMLGASAGANAQAVAPSTGACKPQMYADLAPTSKYIDVSFPLPQSIEIPGHGGATVLLIARPWPTVGADVTASIKATDNDTAPLFHLFNEQLASPKLCDYIVAQWLVNRAGTGELTLTITPITPSAKPKVVTIPIVIH